MTRLYVLSTFNLGQVRGVEDLLSCTWQLKEARVRNARVSSLTGTDPLVMSLGTLLQHGKQA